MGWEMHKKNQTKVPRNTDVLMQQSKTTQTALKKSEQRFRAMFEQAAVGVALIETKTGKYVRINKKYCDFLGYNEQEMLKKTYMDVTYPEDVAINISASSKFVKRDINEFSYDKRYIRKDGDIVWGNLTISPLWKEDQDPDEYLHIAIVVDITDRKEIEKKLTDNAYKLQQINATKDRLFSIIGHDLKTPLNSIVGFSRLIERNVYRYSHEKIYQLNNIILQSSETLSGLLENLLNWSKSCSHSIVIRKEKVVVSPIVQDCFEILRVFANKKNIQMMNLIDLETIVIVDAEMLKAIFRNLLSNAIKFTPHGGFVTVFSIQEQEKRNVIIGIKDTGVGVSSYNIANIFEKEHPCSSCGTDGEKGTGLGLLISKDFVEKNCGKIWVESESGLGTTFFISFPI